MENQKLQKILNEFSELIKRKQFMIVQKKVFEFFKILKPFESNDDYEAYIIASLLMAEAFSKDVKNLKALEELEKISKIFPFETRILNKMFDISVKLKRFAQAETILKSCVSSEPDNNDFKVQLVHFYLEHSQIQKAIGMLLFLIDSGAYDPSLYWMIADNFGKTSNHFHKLNQIKLLQQLKPSNPYLLMEEASVMTSIGHAKKGFDIISDLINYSFETNMVTPEIYSCIMSFSELFIALGYRDLLAEYFIRALLQTEYTKLPLDIKQQLEKYAKENEFMFIFNFIVKPQVIMKYENVPENSILENIIYIVQNKKYFDEKKHSFKDYVRKLNSSSLNLQKNVGKALYPFIYSLIAVEREIN